MFTTSHIRATGLRRVAAVAAIAATATGLMLTGAPSVAVHRTAVHSAQPGGGCGGNC
jgi:hypothetical protein